MVYCFVLFFNQCRRKSKLFAYVTLKMGPLTLMWNRQKWEEAVISFFTDTPPTLGLCSSSHVVQPPCWCHSCTKHQIACGCLHTTPLISTKTVSTSSSLCEQRWLLCEHVWVNQADWVETGKLFDLFSLIFSHLNFLLCVWSRLIAWRNKMRGMIPS